MWFWSNNQQLNPYKLDAAFFGTSQTLRKWNLQKFVIVATFFIAVSEWLKTHSAIIGNMLDLKITSTASSEHATIIYKHCPTFATSNIANTLVCSIDGLQIDYCNALLFEVNDKLIYKLQRVYGNLARLIYMFLAELLMTYFTICTGYPSAVIRPLGLHFCITRDFISDN